MESNRRISFVAFFLIWADVQGWVVPDIHLRICHWLQRRGRLAVLEVFRGAAKSTIVAVYQAWCLYCDPAYRFLDQGADDPVAYKLSKDTRAVLRRHPLCVGMMSTRQVAAGKFDIVGNQDARNSSVTAHGIMSNVTSARADEVIFDDIEVPKNIKSGDSRMMLRTRIGESTHILVPGGKKLYIGTPHTWESIYEEQIEAGADLLKIPLFDHHARFEDPNQRWFPLNFDVTEAYVFLGRKLLDKGSDYEIKGRAIMFAQVPQGLIDIYAGNVWPEYFTRDEIRFRRAESTLNEWDSQYMLVAKPLNQIRLNPDRIIPYAVEPEIQYANGGVRLMLGKTQMVTAAAWWDCALGKINSDTSALCVLFSNERGYLFWHVAQALTGDIYSQCNSILETAVRLQLPSITVETNGPGGFVPPILRKILVGTGIGVVEHHSVGNKDERILDGLEPPISGRFLWAHLSVLDTVEKQMRDWLPGRSNQPDDYLDAAAGAIRATPVRIGRVIGDIKGRPRDDWRPDSGTFEVTLER
ncbi:MAG: phage terminase large subunit [Gammaproteobacteria bacterium]|nr:phage terminase large subunit [Gammaproteobacteria bacterium]